MFSFLKKFRPIHKTPSAEKGGEGYLKARKVAETGDVKQRLALAKSRKTDPEILYYLAEHDPDPVVRSAVVKNKALPVQAGTVLAGDKSEDVRLLLAKRLVDLLPELSKDEHSQLYAYAVKSLGELALDEVLRIRKALSLSLKDHAYAPPKVMTQLAKDIEREVSEPVLRSCLALQDDDLLEILKDHPAAWKVEAVAKRKNISAIVSRAVIDTEEKSAGKILLANKGAEISVPLYKEIIETSKKCPEWHEPLAKRAGLPADIARELSAFADETVKKVLLQKYDFDAVTVAETSVSFKKRLKRAAPVSKDKQDAKERALVLFKAGNLDEEVLSEAVYSEDYDFLYMAVACLSGIKVVLVKKIFDLQAAKPIVALCWKADLSMRFALQMQQDMAHVQPQDLIYPRGGTDYPFTDDEMIWQLEFLGVEAA